MNVKKCHVHPVYVAGIRTKAFSDTRHLPSPVDQSSRPKYIKLSSLKQSKMS